VSTETIAKLYRADDGLLLARNAGRSKDERGDGEVQHVILGGEGEADTIRVGRDLLKDIYWTEEGSGADLETRRNLLVNDGVVGELVARHHRLLLLGARRLIIKLEGRSQCENTAVNSLIAVISKQSRGKGPTVW